MSVDTQGLFSVVIATEVLLLAPDMLFLPRV